MREKDVILKINGKSQRVHVRSNETLLDVLRERLDMTGAKEGCGEGVCGSCTVQMDGKPVRSCLTLAVEADGSEIRTVEGLAHDEQLSPLQQSFIDHGAVQCGFCTSGMLISADALLSENPKPDEKTIRKAISGNICRCTGYAKIVEAVAHAAQPDEHCPDCKQ